MANIKQVSFTAPGGEYAAEQAEIDRRRRMAEMLQQGADEPLQTNRMAGGMVVPISPWEGMARVAKGAMGGIQGARADQMAKALRDRQQGDMQGDIQAYVQALRGRPASPGGLTEDVSGNVTMADPMQARPGGVSPELIQQLRTPQMQGMALQQLMGQMQQEQAPPERVDLGDRIGLVKNGQLVGYLPKWATPDAQIREQGAQQRHLTPSGSAQLGAQTTRDTSILNPAVQTARKEIAAAGRPNVTTNVLPPQKTFENENKLRDDYTTATKPFVGIRDAYNTVQAALSGPITATSTLAGATKFMKMIDPESVVRESELNMALKATGMLDRFMNLHNTVLKGQVLTPKQATEIKAIADTLYTTAAAQQAKTDEYYSGLAKSYGLTPERVIRKQDAVMKNDRRDAPRNDKTVVVNY